MKPIALRVVARFLTSGSVRLTGYHYSNALFESFSLEKASQTAVWGPGIYLSEKKTGLDSWGKNRLDAGYLYEVSVATTADKTVDITKPLPLKTYETMEASLGRPIPPSIKEDGIFPFTTIERRYGTVAEGLRKMGFDVMIHKLNDSHGLHYLVVDPHVARIVKVEQV